MLKASNIATAGCQSRARPLGLEWPKHVSKDKLCATIKDGYMPARSGSTTSINFLGDIIGGSQTWKFQNLVGLSPLFSLKKMSSSGTHFKKHEEQLASGNLRILRIFLPKSFNLGVASCNRILAILKYHENSGT